MLLSYIYAYYTQNLHGKQAGRHYWGAYAFHQSVVMLFNNHILESLDKRERDKPLVD